MSDELKAKIKWSCKFSKKSYQIIEGYLRIVEHTNLAYVEPHKVLDNDYYKLLKEDLELFAKNNYEELSILKGERENLWKRYHRAKTEEKQSEILAEINDIQPKIKELRKYDNYCKNIKKQSESIQDNINNFDKDLQKEKDNARYLKSRYCLLSFNNCNLFINSYILLFW